MDYLKHIAYDSVVFGFEKKSLKILLIRYHHTGLYALPGGFVKKNEALDDAVGRGLEERTGLKNIYLKQFHTFGSMHRFNPEVMLSILKANQLGEQENAWMLERFISVAYYSLINHKEVQLSPDSLSDSCTWYDVKELPELMLDHQEILEKALQSLRSNLIQNPGMIQHLLPDKFTMKELQEVHETILGEQLHRGAFQRKMLALDILHRHEKQFTGAANKAPFLYSFMRNKI